MSVLKKLFILNQALCSKLERYLPQARVNIFYLYEKTVARFMNSCPNQTIVDVGGGKTCPFAQYKEPDMNAKIIAVDVLQEEVQNNFDVDEKRLANIMQHLPFGNNEVDLVVSRSVLEHLENVEGFVVESNRVLKRNGYFIHLFPSKFALFAIINQLLPRPLSRRLLYAFRPDARGVCGFPAYYNKCSDSSIKSLLKRHGYEIIDSYCSYSQTSYFNFFIPLFLIVALYEIILQLVRAKNLCAYVLIVARKAD